MDNEKYESIITKLTRIETMLEDFNDIKEKTTEAYTLSKSNEKRLDKIEDGNKWLFRTTIGAVLTGLIAIVLNFIK